MKTNETMSGAARHRDARANGPSVAEIVNLSNAEIAAQITADLDAYGDTTNYLMREAARALAASAQQISAPLIPVETVEAAQKALNEMQEEGADLYTPAGDVVCLDDWYVSTSALIDAARAQHAALAGAQPKDDSSS